MQREVWTALGAADPDWAVLTVPQRRAGGWDEHLDEFYSSGRSEIDACLSAAAPVERGRALDFGCGTGRLSLALAEQFEQVTACDISQPMLDELISRAADRKIGNIVTVSPSRLTHLAPHDFAISLLVMQHLESLPAVDVAVAQVAASLKPGGVAVIELPRRARQIRARLQPRFRIYRVVRRAGVSAGRLQRWGFSGISMLTVNDARARRMFTGHGLELVAAVDRRDPDYDYVRWILRKQPPAARDLRNEANQTVGPAPSARAVRRRNRGRGSREPHDGV
jgi:SAM-dependent methyltransferase